MEDSGIPAPHSTPTSIYVGYSQPVDLSPGKQKACGTCSGPAGGGSSFRQTVGPRPAGDGSKSEGLGLDLEASVSDTESMVEGKKGANCHCLSSCCVLSPRQDFTCIFSYPHSHPGKLLYRSGNRVMGQGWGWGVTHPHSRALLWQISDSNRSCWWSHFHLPSVLPSLSPSLSSSPTQPSLPPHPSSLLYWNPDSLLLPTALFTLSTEHPRENIFPKKTNVEEPEMGIGESLSPIKKTQLSTAAEASEMKAR